MGRNYLEVGFLILRSLVYNAGLADVRKWALFEHDNLMWWEMDAPWIHHSIWLR
jgi:hypothetical protein